MKNTLFKRELSLIKCDTIREAAELVINDTPEWVFHMPISTSKKYHPIEDCEDLGTANHLKKAFYMSQEAARRYSSLDLDRDIIKAAALIHDIPFKFKDDENGNKVTCWLHPFRNAKHIIMRCTMLPDNIVRQLAAGVFFHMGRWANYQSPESMEVWDLVSMYRESSIVKSVQESDYYVSRRFNHLNIDEAYEYEISKMEKESKKC